MMFAFLARALTTPKNARLPQQVGRHMPGKPRVTYLAIALLAFSVLLQKVRRGETSDFDEHVTHALQQEGRKHRGFNRLMHVVSWPGFPPQSRIIPPSLATLLWWRGYRLEAVFQLAAWGTGGISSIFKRRIRRERPGPKQPHLTVVPANIGGTSFPSGHVIIYTGVYGFLAYLSGIWIESRSIRRVVVAALTALVALVGTSRVYLGHHWFTDTVASYLLGTSYLVVLVSLYRRIKRWSLRI